MVNTYDLLQLKKLRSKSFYIENIYFKMYSSVKFYDEIYYVCKSNFICVKKGIIKATYNDRRKNPAIIIAKHSKLKHFTSLNFHVILI